MFDMWSSTRGIKLKHSKRRKRKIGRFLMIEYLRIDSTWCIQPNGQRFPEIGGSTRITIPFNCLYELKEYPYYENDPFEYMDWMDPDDFQRMTQPPYPQNRVKRPTTFQVSRKHTHYIPSLPRGNPIRIMYIPCPIPERWNTVCGTYYIDSIYIRNTTTNVSYELTLSYSKYTTMDALLRRTPLMEQSFSLIAPICHPDGFIKWTFTKPVSLSFDPILVSTLCIEGLYSGSHISDWWVLLKRGTNLGGGV